jgi:putative endonuclease
MAHDRRAAERRGRWAESLAGLALRLRGYRILARRFRAPGGGEIDIVAWRGGVLACVEVKARPDAGTALEAVGPYQRRRVERAAQAYLAVCPARFRDAGVRFDVMIVRPWRWPVLIADAWRPGWPG